MENIELTLEERKRRAWISFLASKGWETFRAVILLSITLPIVIYMFLVAFTPVVQTTTTTHKIYLPAQYAEIEANKNIKNRKSFNRADQPQGV